MTTPAPVRKTEKKRKHYAVCDVCNHVYQQKESYCSHMKKVHGKELPGLKKYICKDCSHVEYTFMAYKAHLMQHTGERHECDICGYKSIYRGDVTKHKKSKHKN